MSEPAPTSADGEPTEPVEELELTETIANGDQATASREAASYRRRLRETEAERDVLRERVTALERAEVERIAGEYPLSMTSPADLWLVGVELEELRDDEGRLDEERVRERVRDVLEERPSWRKEVDLGGGARGGVPLRRSVGLSALLKDER